MVTFYLSFNADENVSSGEREDALARPPLVEDRLILCEGKGNERVHLEEWESSSRREGEHRGRVLDSEQRTFSSGIVTAQRRIKKAKTSSGKRKMKSLQRVHKADELLAKDKTPQSTSSLVDQWETAGPSICQSVSENMFHKVSVTFTILTR